MTDYQHALPLPPRRQHSKFRHDLLTNIQRWHPSQGDLVYVNTYSEPFYAIFNPELIRDFLTSNADRIVRHQRPISVIEQWNGKSLLVSEGADWHRQRRTVQAGFAAKKMPAYAKSMVETTALYLDDLPGESDGVVDFEPMMAYLAVSIMHKILFGALSEPEPRQSLSRQEIHNLARANRILEYVSLAESLPPKWADPNWAPSEVDKQWAIEMVDGLVSQNVASRQGLHRPVGAHEDFLDVLLTSHPESDSPQRAREIRNHCVSLFLAGQSTSASALVWWAFAMSKNPDSAAAATEEVDRVLGGSFPTYEDLGHLEILGQCVRESLRMFPPTASLVTRETLEDISLNDSVIPKGSLVILPIYAIHHDARWFSEPERFDHDRFSTKRRAEQVRGSFMPFGAGPRVCIGNNFSLVEITLVAAMILQKFKLSLVTADFDPKMTFDFNLQPADGMPIRLTRR